MVMLKFPSYRFINSLGIEILDSGGRITVFKVKKLFTISMDFVFTVCDHAANEECPTWAGQPISAHWGLPDPVAATGTDAERALAFQETYAALKSRLTAFVALPFDSLDRIGLQRAVDDLAT